MAILVNVICEQQRHKSAWAFRLSDYCWLALFVIRFLYSIIHVPTVAVVIIPKFWLASAVEQVGDGFVYTLQAFWWWGSYEPPHDKTNKMTCTPSEDSDQPGHPPSLIRVFAVRMKKAWVLSYLLSAQGRLWSDWADAQANLSLCWAHSHFVGFVMRQLMWCSIKGLLSHFKLAIHVHVQLYFSIKSWLYT